MMVKLLGPQQTAWMPMSSLRAAGLLLVKTSGEQSVMGPTAGCGQEGQPWASASTCALSPSLAAAGIRQLLLGTPQPRILYHFSMGLGSLALLSYRSTCPCG